MPVPLLSLSPLPVDPIPLHVISVYPVHPVAVGTLAVDAVPGYVLFVSAHLLFPLRRCGNFLAIAMLSVRLRVGVCLRLCLLVLRRSRCCFLLATHDGFKAALGSRRNLSGKAMRMRVILG